VSVTEPLQTTDCSSNTGVSDSSDQSKEVLHYAQSAMVMDSLNKQVGYLAISMECVGQE